MSVTVEASQGTSKEVEGSGTMMIEGVKLWKVEATVLIRIELMDNKEDSVEPYR